MTEALLLSFSDSFPSSSVPATDDPSPLSIEFCQRENRQPFTPPLKKKKLAGCHEQIANFKREFVEKQKKLYTFLMSDLREAVGSKDTRLVDLSFDPMEFFLLVEWSLEEYIWSPDGFLHRYTICRNQTTKCV